MEVGFFNKLPWLPLVLLCLTYALFRWHLSAYSVIWLVGSFVLAAILSVVLFWGGTYFLPKVRLGIRDIGLVTMQMTFPLI